MSPQTKLCGKRESLLQLVQNRNKSALSSDLQISLASPGAAEINSLLLALCGFALSELPLWSCVGVGGRAGSYCAVWHPSVGVNLVRAFSGQCFRLHSTKLQETSVRILKLLVRGMFLIKNSQEKTDKVAWCSVAVSPAGHGSMFCTVLLSYIALPFSAQRWEDTKS